MMNPLGPKDWEKSTFRAAVGGLVFGSVLVLLDKGCNWLISEKTSGQDDFFFIVGLALVMYFNEAINSIHGMHVHQDEELGFARGKVTSGGGRVFRPAC